MMERADEIKWASRRSDRIWRIFWLLITIIVFSGAILLSTNESKINEKNQTEENGHNPLEYQINKPKLNVKQA